MKKTKARENDLGRGLRKSFPILYAEVGAERDRDFPFWLALPIVVVVLVGARVLL
jgi:hypothetical protein